MVELNEKAGKGEQRTICEACGNSNLAHDRAVWTDDGASFCPDCAALPAPDDGLVERQIRTLLCSFVAEHFPENMGWKPLPDILGMVSQLDNAITIARDYRAQIERLTQERDEWRGHVQKQNENVAHNLCRAETAEQQVQKLTAENERLREALRPFARIAAAEDYSDTPSGKGVIVNVDRCRDARSALETQEGGE